MELFQPDTRQESNSPWLLANSRIQSRYAQVGELSLKPRETEHSNPLSLSPLHVKWMGREWGGYHDMKNVYSLAPITQALIWLRHWGNQANSSLCVCVCVCVRGRERGGEISTRAGLLHSAVFAEINPASPVVPDSRRCLCQLSAMPLCSILLAVCCRDCCPTLSTQPPCFHNSSGTDGWHSCSVGPHGLLKKAINQSRHSIQAGNWPIRVAQDAYVQADDFTNWLSIYTNTGTPQEKFTGCSQCINVFSQATDTTS